MRKYLFLGLLALLAACATPQAPQQAQRVPQPAPRQALGPTCQPGELVRNTSAILPVAVVAVEETLATMGIIDDLQRGILQKSRPEQIAIMSDTTRQIAIAAHNGQIEPFGGHAVVRYLIHWTNPLPPQLPFFGGDNICRGMVAVEPVTDGIYQVRVPLEGGQWKGQVGLVFPREAFVTPHQRAWVCVGIEGGHLAYQPPLREGPYKDVPDLICGLPDPQGGTTLLGRTAQTAKFEMFPFVVARR